MDSNNFFQYQIELLNEVVIRFEYPKRWKGFALKSIVVLCAMNVSFWILAETNFLVNNVTDLENNSETFAICATTIYALIQYLVIFIKKRDFGRFVEELNDDIRHLQQSEEFIGITKASRKWLRFVTRIRHSFGVFAGIMMCIKAVLKSFVTGKRHLPVNIK